MTQKRRGRPRKFTCEDRSNLAELIRQHGAGPTREISPAPICSQTLLKIAREFDIKLKQGRRPRKAA
jgi:hypothetical protein